MIEPDDERTTAASPTVVLENEAQTSRQPIPTANGDPQVHRQVNGFTSGEPNTDRRNWIELNLNSDEQALVTEAAVIHKTIYINTFDNVFKIARALDILQKRHSRAGVNVSLDAALVQFGFINRGGGAMQKSIRSDYKALLDHEADVRAWWTKVKEDKKRHWHSARAISKNWRASQRAPDEPKRLSPLARERERSRQLQEQLVEANERLKAADGDLYDLLKTGPETIGKVIVDTLRMHPSKIEKLITTLKAELKELKVLTKAARPRGEKGVKQ